MQSQYPSIEPLLSYNLYITLQLVVQVVSVLSPSTEAPQIWLQSYKYCYTEQSIIVFIWYINCVLCLCAGWRLLADGKMYWHVYLRPRWQNHMQGTNLQFQLSVCSGQIWRRLLQTRQWVHRAPPVEIQHVGTRRKIEVLLLSHN